MKISDYRVISEKVVPGRVYKLIEVTSSSTYSKTRSNFLHKLMERANAIGLIEWWEKGSIVRKPQNRFFCVLILHKP